ncbi:MAG: RagB/SusD family nutrient uptake outer membrane protein [Bacteroidota bacterium]
MKNKLAYSFLLLVAFSLSCNKDFLTEKPLAEIAPDNLYVNKAGFESGLYGIYNLWRAERKGINGASNDMAMTPAFIGVDNAYSLRPAGNAPEQVFNDFGVRLNPSDSYIKRVWEWLYQVVNATNTLIDRSNTTGINWTAAEKAQIVGEAKLMRAWAYRHLTYLFGAVPLNLVESKGSTIRTDWERTPVATIRQAMEKDLLDAEAGMSDLPVVEGRASKVVAQHYLAELYLAMGEYAKARDKALAVIQNTKYRWVTARYGINASKPGTPFTDMFLDGNSNRSQGNTEVLWVIQNEYLSNGGDANIMRRWWVNRYNEIKVGSPSKTPITYSVENGGRGLGRFAVTKYAFSLYGATDHRGSSFAWRFFYLMNNPASIPTNVNINAAATCATPGYTSGPAGGRLGIDTVRLSVNCTEPAPNATSASNWPSITKWDWAPADIADVQNSSNYNDQIYLRLAETYLILAEAQFYLNDLNGAAATLNTLRARANATPITPAQVTLSFILDERSRELVTEEHRRYTLLRTGTWFARTQQYNVYAGTKITLRDTILPIPQSVIDANLTKVMPQNNGY